MLILLLMKTGRQLKFQRMDLFQATQLTDPAQMGRSWLFGESEMRNTAFQEDRARNRQAN